MIFLEGSSVYQRKAHARRCIYSWRKQKMKHAKLKLASAPLTFASTHATTPLVQSRVGVRGFANYMCHRDRTVPLFICHHFYMLILPYYCKQSRCMVSRLETWNRNRFHEITKSWRYFIYPARKPTGEHKRRDNPKSASSWVRHDLLWRKSVQHWESEALEYQ